MALPAIRKRLDEGGFMLSAWLALPEPLVHEAFIRAPFDAATFDAQHGLIDMAGLRTGIERAVLLGKPAFVRLPIEGRALGAQVLDFGASGVIMPMIEGPDDAKAFVDAVKYPPLGQRSFGPSRCAPLLGYEGAADYVAGAREETFALAMIETASALDKLDAIMAVDGLDGVLVGPSDLSIALSGTGTLDPQGEVVVAAMKRVVETATRAGKIPATYGTTAEAARTYRAMGYRFVAVSSDMGVLASGANALAAAVKG